MKLRTPSSIHDDMDEPKSPIVVFFDLLDCLLGKIVRIAVPLLGMVRSVFMRITANKQHLRTSCAGSYGYATLCSDSNAPASHRWNCPPASTTSSTNPAGGDREQHSHRLRIDSWLSKAQLRYLQLLSEDICLLCDLYHRIQDK